MVIPTITKTSSRRLLPLKRFSYSCGKNWRRNKKQPLLLALFLYVYWIHDRRPNMVLGVGVEPTKAEAGRFTV